MSSSQAVAGYLGSRAPTGIGVARKVGLVLGREVLERQTLGLGKKLTDRSAGALQLRRRTHEGGSDSRCHEESEDFKDVLEEFADQIHQ